MKIFLIIILLINVSLSQRELNKLTNQAFGRYDFKCFNDSTCYSIDMPNHQNQFITITKDQGNSWNEILRFSTTIDPINIPGGIMDYAYIYDTDSYYFLDDWNQGSLFWTHDAGETFNYRNIKIFGNASFDILMLDSLNGVISHNIYLIYTRDGWNSWDTIRYDNIYTYRKFYKKSDSTFYVTGSVNKSEQGVDEWYDCILEVSLNSLDHEIKYIFPNKDIGTFSEKYLYFYNKDIGFIGGSFNRESEQWVNDIIYKTTDGGNSWYKVLEEYNGYFSLKDIAMSKDGQYGLTVDANKYYETFDGGESWHFGFWHPPEGEPYHVTCRVEFAGNRCLIGSMGKGIYAWEEVTSVSLEDIGNLKVWQSGSTFRVGSDINELQINIFDLQGNKVNTEHFNKNTIIDLSDKPTGTYLFNIIHQNLIIKSGKLSVMN